MCDPTDQANLFSEFFASTYRTDDGVLPDFPSRVPADISMSNSFSNQAVDCGNSLPNELVSSGSIAAFSRALKQIELSKFIKGMPSET